MSMAFLSIPLVVFFVFVAPMWLWLHYRSKRQVVTGLSEDDAQQMQALAERVKVLQTRIHALECILDEDGSDWRQRS